MYTPRLDALPPADAVWVEIRIAEQRLVLWHGQEEQWSCRVSTAEAGAGQDEGSGRTPLGWHYIRASIGRDQPPGCVFRGRRPTGEVFDAALAKRYPGRDWILTRIIWLCGLEPGVNRGGSVDSQRRYIYLHGTPPDQPMGVARSHGCIRMRDMDLMMLFEQAVPGTAVWIHL